ncbi:MAG: c-type cytochrome [Pseudomonadota bacterium]
MGMRTIGSITAAVVAALSSSAAIGAEDVQARSWAASCAACHGTNGASVGGMPTLAGKRKDELLASMKGFKAGTKPATVMHQHAKGYTDDQLARIAEFFSKQKP